MNDTDDLQKLHNIANQTYKDQAIWFLNNFTKCHNDVQTSDIVFKIHQKYLEYDKRNYSHDHNNTKSSQHISDLNAHLILESFGKPETQSAFRNYVLSIDPVFKNETPLIILLFFYFDSDWKTLMNKSSSCYNDTEISRAKSALDEAKMKLKEAVDAEYNSSEEVKEADAAMDKYLKEQEILTKAISGCQIQEESFAEAKSQAEQALEQVSNQEGEFLQKIHELEMIVNNKSNGIVTRNKARAELRIMKQENTLPLRQARLKNENALKKLEKSTKASENARIAAEDAKERVRNAMEDASLAKERAVEASKSAETIIPEARAAIDNLKCMLDKMMKNKNGFPWGSIYYIDREVEEAEKFLPKKKIKKLKEIAEENKRRLSAHRAV